MNRAIDRRRVLYAGLALGAGFVVPGARAHEILTSTLRVIHPWSRATARDATFAVLCMKFDEVVEADRLILVESPVASGAEMGGAGAGPDVSFLIPEGQETVLSEAGTYIRLLGLKFPLEVGRSYPLRLGFEKGGVFNTSFGVDHTQLE